MKRKTLFLLLIVIITVFVTTTSMYADGDVWECAKCGAEASGNFCSKCGAAKPEWECPQCGKMVVGNFCSNCGAEKPKSFSDIRIGDYIEFGRFEQDNNYSNGSEPIEWLVLDRQESSVLVISKYALDARPYNPEWVNVTWEMCELREWLNGEYYKEAFSAVEQKRIEETVVKAEDNRYFGTDAGNETRDKVFLLSISEAEIYFEDDDARICYPTEYALAQGAESSAGCFWWLRSPGDDNIFAANVYDDGQVFCNGDDVDHYNFCVRPAIWINLEP